MRGKLIVVSGGQFGSEAKGHTAAMLTSPAQSGSNVACVRVGGPNAGHIVYGKCPSWCVGTLPGDNPEVYGEPTWGSEPTADHMFNGEFIGHPWKLRQVPVAAVSNPDAVLFIAAGSEVHEPTLREELDALDDAGYGATRRTWIDRMATLLTSRHVEQEKHRELTARLGSTSKGIGAARVDRLWRTAEVWGMTKPYSCVSVADEIYAILNSGGTVAIEGTQGYGLGLHHPNYPFTTSTDCRAIDFLSQAGVSPWHPSVERFESWVVARVRPIRVAGNSGPMKGETSWSELGLPEERTTVTRKVRRVGEWDSELVRDAVRANGGSEVRMALTMVDTLFPFTAGQTDWWKMADKAGPMEMVKLTDWIDRIEHEVGTAVDWLGTSPTTGVWVQKP